MTDRKPDEGAGEGGADGHPDAEETQSAEPQGSHVPPGRTDQQEACCAGATGEKIRPTEKQGSDGPGQGATVRTLTFPCTGDGRPAEGSVAGSDMVQ